MSNITNTCLYQACTKITNIPSQDMCLNHVPKHVPNHQPVPYQASTMYHNLYHNKCINHAPNLYHISTINHHQPCINHVPYHVPCLNHQPCTSTPYTMYHTMYQHVHQQCTSTPVPYHVPTMYLNHIPYHSIMPYTIYHRIYQASTINGVPQPSTNITKRCISYMCCHIPSVILNNVSISMTTIHHVPMLQEYTKNKPQACTIASSPCNQTRYQDTNTTKMYYYSMYHTNITKMYHASTRHASQACTIPSPSIRYNHISIPVTCS
jgi:hypothetical protein